MTDILGKEIVEYEEACYLKEMRFDWPCTGYYHCDDYGEQDCGRGEDSYECVGWRALYKNSFSLFRAAAPRVKAAKLWYRLYGVTPFENLT